MERPYRHVPDLGGSMGSNDTGWSRDLPAFAAFPEGDAEKLEG